MFEDPYFPVDSALGEDLAAKYPGVTWLRASEVPGASLFGEANGMAISPADVVEGALDDCYLVGALTLLAQHPSMVKALFHAEKSSSHDGRHCVRVWQQGTRIEVVVDDRIPCDPSSSQPIFARCRRSSGFWVQIVEKAFAKLHGSYGSLSGGSTAEALHDLTGRPVFDYNLEQPDVRADIREGQLWSEVCEHVQAHSMVACEAIKSGPRVEADSHQGLILNHAYCVLEARELAAERGSDPVKMLRLRNPWGSAPTWSGPFCAGSSEWMLLTAQARACASQDGSTGCFWLSWDAFCSAFNRIHVCWMSAAGSQGGGAGASQGEGSGGVWDKGGGLDSEGGVPVARVACSVSELESGGCSYSPTFWHNPAFVLRRQHLPAAPGEAEDAQDTGRGCICDGDDDVHQDIVVAVTLCLRDKRRQLRGLGLGAHAPLSYLQVGTSILRPRKRHSPHGHEGGGESWAKGEGEVDASSPLCLLPGNHQVCGRSRFWNKREVSRRVSLKMGEELVVVPSTWEAGVPVDYVLLIHQWKRGRPGFFFEKKLIFFGHTHSYVSLIREWKQGSPRQLSGRSTSLWCVKCTVNVLGH